MKMKVEVVSVDAVLLDFNQKIVGHGLSKKCLNEWIDDKSNRLKSGIYYYASLNWFTDGSSVVTGIDFDNRVIVL